MKDQTADLLENLELDSFLVVRKIIIDMIIATDMGRHFDMLGNFRARVNLSSKPALDAP